MGLVVGDLMLLIVIVTGTGLLLFYFSAKRDRQKQAAQQLLAESERKRAELNAMLYKESVPLICLNCDTHFLGPLTTDGCPNCHVSSLTVTEDEYSKSKEQE